MTRTKLSLLAILCISGQSHSDIGEYLTYENLTSPAIGGVAVLGIGVLAVLGMNYAKLFESDTQVASANDIDDSWWDERSMPEKAGIVGVPVIGVGSLALWRCCSYGCLAGLFAASQTCPGNGICATAITKDDKVLYRRVGAVKVIFNNSVTEITQDNDPMTRLAACADIRSTLATVCGSIEKFVNAKQAFHPQPAPQQIKSLNDYLLGGGFRLTLYQLSYAFGTTGTLGDALSSSDWYPGASLNYKLDGVVTRPSCELQCVAPGGNKTVTQSSSILLPDEQIDALLELTQDAVKSKLQGEPSGVLKKYAIAAELYSHGLPTHKSLAYEITEKLKSLGDDENDANTIQKQAQEVLKKGTAFPAGESDTQYNSDRVLFDAFRAYLLTHPDVAWGIEEKGHYKKLSTFIDVDSDKGLGDANTALNAIITNPYNSIEADLAALMSQKMTEGHLKQWEKLSAALTDKNKNIFDAILEVLKGKVKPATSDDAADEGKVKQATSDDAVDAVGALVSCYTYTENPDLLAQLAKVAQSCSLTLVNGKDTLQDESRTDFSRLDSFFISEPGNAFTSRVNNASGDVRAYLESVRTYRVTRANAKVKALVNDSEAMNKLTDKQKLEVEPDGSVVTVTAGNFAAIETVLIAAGYN